MAEVKSKVKIVATNRKATYNYFITERYEAGIVLLGSEVKSLRDGKAQLLDSYGILRGGELYILNMHIQPYKHANIQNHEPLRTRKLLMKKSEILKLSIKMHEKGLSLIPLKVYFKKGLAKIELGLGKGKKKYDKREAIKKKEAKRSIKRYI
jgi:SsrA-binding protein